MMNVDWHCATCLRQLADWHRVGVLNGEATPHTRFGTSHTPEPLFIERFFCGDRLVHSYLQCLNQLGI